MLLLSVLLLRVLLSVVMILATVTTFYWTVAVAPPSTTTNAIATAIAVAVESCIRRVAVLLVLYMCCYARHQPSVLLVELVLVPARGQG